MGLRPIWDLVRGKELEPGDSRLPADSGDTPGERIVIHSGAEYDHWELKGYEVIGAGFGLTGGQQSSRPPSTCSKFVDNVVTITEIHVERGKRTVDGLGVQFLLLAGAAEKLGKAQKFDGFKELYTGKVNDKVGQKWAVYQHVYGFIGASLIGNSRLPQLFVERFGVQTGIELVEKQLKEDIDQRDHPEKYPEKDQQGIEASQEVADDLAGIAASNLIRERVGSPGLMSTPQLRHQLFNLFCDR